LYKAKEMKFSKYKNKHSEGLKEGKYPLWGQERRRHLRTAQKDIPLVRVQSGKQKL